MSQKTSPETIGRYTLFSEIAAGGMATVHFGRLAGPAGFARIVAVKRLMPNLARDPEFVAMFLDEARVAARIRHPNVVPTLDIVAAEGELLLIMEYVQGESLSRLIRAARQADVDIPMNILSAIVTGALHGLHAAHEATSENGEPLNVVHRDVSPQNLLVGEDGVVRVLDFGIASAVGRLQVTRDGQLKGKLAYMAPEQFWSKPVDRRADVYAMAVVLWECLTQRRLFKGDSDAALITAVLHEPVAPPSTFRTDTPPALDALVFRGLHREVTQRFATAREMAIALEELIPPATATQIGRWVESLAGDVLKLRSQRIQDIESSAHAAVPPGVLPQEPRATAPLEGPVSPVELALSPTPSGSSRRRIALAGVAGLAVFGLAWGLARQEHPEAALPAASASSVTPVLASSPAVVPQPPPAPSSAAPPVVSAPPPTVVPRGTTAPRPPAQESCNPPFYTDAKGIQRVKRNCLK